MYITSTTCQLSGAGHFSYSNKIFTLINLQNNTGVISRYVCNGNTHLHHIDPMYVFKGHLIPSLSSESWPSGYDVGLVILRPCRAGGSNPTLDNIFCNVHLFRVPRSWTGTVQIQSSMTFIRGNGCI